MNGNQRHEAAERTLRADLVSLGWDVVLPLSTTSPADVVSLKLPSADAVEEMGGSWRLWEVKTGTGRLSAAQEALAAKLGHRYVSATYSVVAGRVELRSMNDGLEVVTGPYRFPKSSLRPL